MARVVYEESFLYAHKRKTFGKPLIKHAVIRQVQRHTQAAGPLYGRRYVFCRNLHAWLV